MVTTGSQQTHDQAHGWVRQVARVGLVTYGVVYLVMAWLSGQIAFGGGGGEASSTGALQQIAQQSFGSVLLWFIVVGLAAMCLWQLSAAAYGESWLSDDDRRKEQAKHVGRAIIYAYLSYAAFKVVSGSGGAGGSGGGSQEESLTATLLGAPAGRLLVAAVGVAIIVAGVIEARRGLDEGFTDKLTHTTSVIVRLGKAGYLAKGATLGVVGILFGLAALRGNAEQAGGMDQALSTLRDQPFGQVALVLIALGLAAYGLFCFAWARYPRT